MNKRIGRRFAVENITISISLICVLLFVVSCGAHLDSTRVLPIRPVSQTCHSSYSNITKIYESDDEIVLVSTWNPVSKSEGHKIRWEIYNSIGERVYATRDYEITIHPNMSNFYRMRFDQKIKNRLSPGMCKIKMYLDDKLRASHDIEYVKTSIINHNINGAVILPFRFAASSPTDSTLPMRDYLNTLPNAIYGEVKRIVKDTVPPAVAEERIGDLYYSRNVNDKDLMRSIAESFSEDILITGSHDASWPSGLTVCVYHSRTQAMKRFTYSTVIGVSIAVILGDLIQGILYEKGLLDYLRTL